MAQTKSQSGFTLIELLVVVAIIALLIAILLPSLSRAKESGRRVVCGQNLKGIGTACKTYSVDNNRWWPTVATWKHMLYSTSTTLTSMGGTNGLPRDQISEDTEEPPPPEGNAGPEGKEVSPSRALWLLVRLNQVSAKTFICPSSNDDIADPTRDTANYYDFKGYGYLSYGYQMPFYVTLNQCKPMQGVEVDNRMVFLADKNPGITRSEQEAVESLTAPASDVVGYNSTWVGPDGDGGTALNNEPPANSAPYLNPELDLGQFRKFNSPNHGRRGEGEGQNICRADGSVKFVRTPLAGVDQENIYSLQGTPGLSPFASFNQKFYTGTYPGNGGNRGCPGFKSISNARFSSTDSMLFP